MKCRGYYSEEAKRNIRQGFIELYGGKHLSILRCPCAGIVELKSGKCPECGWKPDHDEEGNLLGRARLIWDETRKAERDWSRLRKEMDDYVRRRDLVERLERV